MTSFIKYIFSLKEKYTKANTFFYATHILGFHLIAFMNAFFLNSDIVSVIIFLMATIFLFLFKGKYRLFFLINLVFMAPILKTTFTSTSLSTILILVFFIYESVIFVLPYFNKNLRKIRGVFVSFALLIILAINVLILWLIYINGRPGFNRIFSFINVMCLLVALVIFVKRKKLFDDPSFSLELFVNFSLSLLFASFLTLPIFVTSLGRNFYEFIGSREYDKFIVLMIGENISIVRFAGTFHDPNISGLFFVFIFTASTLLFRRLKDLFGRLLPYGMVGSSLLFALLSFSKMVFALIAFVILVLFIIYLIDCLRTKKKINIAIVYLPIIFIALLLTFFNEIPNVIIGRFSEGYMLDFETTINSLTTGRFFIAKEISIKILENFKVFLFGFGIENTSSFTASGNSPHDTFIQLIVSFGVISSTIYLLFLLSIFKSLKSNLTLNHNYDQRFFILLIPSLGLFALPLLTTNTIYVLALILSALVLQERKIKTDEKKS